MFHDANGFFAEGFYTDDLKFQQRDKTYKYNYSPLFVITHKAAYLYSTFTNITYTNNILAFRMLYYFMFVGSV